MDTTDLHPTTTAMTGAPRRFGRSPLEAVDLAPQDRPGVPAERRPEPWPNARFPPERIERMTARPAVPKHGRPHKQMPPVYGTAVPLRGLSGAIRRAAYRLPDHVATHWLLLLLGDRVDAWGTRARRVGKIAAPLAALGVLGMWLAPSRRG